MLKSSVIAAALLAAATMPSYAASMSAMPMSKCDDASMTMMQGKIDGMTNMAHKKMATKEMMMAKSSMEANKMKTCSMHMDKAMKDIGSTM